MNEMYSTDMKFRQILGPKMNFGYWKGPSDNFHQATEELLLQLLRRIEKSLDFDVSNIHSALVVGCGSGWELEILRAYFVFIDQCDIQVDGLEIVQNQVDEANQILHDQPNLNVYQGDACLYENWPRKSYDLVLAVDCAYHFDTRVEFLKIVKQSACSRLGLVDFCINWPSTLTCTAQLLQSMAGIPIENQVSREEYRHQLIQAGFSISALDDVSRHVFSGFSRFAWRKWISLFLESDFYGFAAFFPIVFLGFTLELLFRLAILEMVVVVAGDS